MYSQQEYIEKILPYRMQAVDTFNLALGYLLEWDEPSKMDIYFNAKLSISGLSTGFTNPVIEAGIIHCRALLEFLGIKVDQKDGTKLIERKNKRNSDDYVIEDFSGPSGNLQRITIDQALAPYAGPKEEAELALASIISCANKGLAHMTTGHMINENELHLYEIASRGVPILIGNYFFHRLGLDMSDYCIKSK